MFVTHLPSNILVILMPMMPTEKLSIVMLCLRYCISQMDVPTRNAYVQAVVDPEERSAANGILNVVRTIGKISISKFLICFCFLLLNFYWFHFIYVDVNLGTAFGPLVFGHLYERRSTMDSPFYIAGTLKIIYDLLLVYNMLDIKPASERARELKCAVENDDSLDDDGIEISDGPYSLVPTQSNDDV